MLIPHLFGRKVEQKMAERKQTFRRTEVSRELKELIDESQRKEITEEELREQRISFAFGNAMDSNGITKDSVRKASQHIRLLYDK